eukprot:3924_1
MPNAKTRVQSTKYHTSNAPKTRNMPRITVRDQVKCKKQQCNGTVRFIGTPYSVKDSGVFYGVELDEPIGKNNGTVKGRWYFTCKDRFGVFLNASGLTALTTPHDTNIIGSQQAIYPPPTPPVYQQSILRNHPSPSYQQPTYQDIVYKDFIASSSSSFTKELLVVRNVLQNSQ